jgi:hypothetical protein
MNLPPGVMLADLEPERRFGRRHGVRYLPVACERCHDVVAEVQESGYEDVRDVMLVMCEHCGTGKYYCARCVAKIDGLTYCADCRKVCACGHIAGQHWARGCDKDGCQCDGFSAAKEGNHARTDRSQ